MALKKESKLVKVIEKIEDPRVPVILKELDALQSKLKELSKHTHEDMFEALEVIKDLIPSKLVAGSGILIKDNKIFNVDPGTRAVDKYSETLKVKLEDIFNNFKKGFESLSAAIKVVSQEVEQIQLSTHIHANMEELDSIEDGFHSEREDNPHKVTYEQVGTASRDHAHLIYVDPEIAKLKEKLENKADKDHDHKSGLPSKIKECIETLSKISFRVDALEDKLNRLPSKLFDLDNDFRFRIRTKRDK